MNGLLIDNLSLWEIRIPTRVDSIPVTLDHHRAWDTYVCSITKGLTLSRATKGNWLSGGRVCQEDMIPVQIACTNEQIRQIAEFTANYYEQEAVFYYRISDYACVYHRTPDPSVCPAGRAITIAYYWAAKVREHNAAIADLEALKTPEHLAIMERERAKMSPGLRDAIDRLDATANEVEKMIYGDDTQP